MKKVIMLLPESTAAVSFGSWSDAVASRIHKAHKYQYYNYIQAIVGVLALEMQFIPECGKPSPGWVHISQHQEVK